VISSVVCVLYRQPQHPLFAAWEKRAWELLRESTIPQQQLALSAFLLHLGIWRGDYRRCAASLREIQGISDVREDAPLIFIALKSWEVILHFVLAEPDAAVPCRRRGSAHRGSARRSPVRRLVHGYVAYAASSAGDLDKADEVIARMEASVIPSRGHDVAFLHHLKGTLALTARRSRRGPALYARRSRARRVGGALFNVALSRIVLAQVLIEQGEPRAGAGAAGGGTLASFEAMPGPHFIS